MSVVLLIDDEEEILDALERMLMAEEYSVLKALDAETALNLLQDHPVQLVICDVMLTGINGFEFCKIIKNNMEYSLVPIILLTAKNTIQAKVEGLEIGADAYIEKPFVKSHLLAQIKNLLQNRQKLYDFFMSSPLTQLKTGKEAYNPDMQFLKKLEDCLRDNIKNPELNVEKLARKMAVSRAVFYRRLTVITDISPNELINLSRLKAAILLLAEGQLPISEVSSLVGFKTQSSFNRQFLRQFKMTPTEYIKKLREGINHS